ncbi:unnamed protein product [[Candida] boidinii]|nr:unnamed protein product [[Candida] boidinii]
MEQFIEFVKEIELFETDARNFLNGFHHSHAENNGSVSVNNGGNLSNNEVNGGNLVNCEEEIEDLISTGRTFGINLDSVKLLERILSRRKWLNKINDDKYVKDIKLLKKLVEEGDSVCSGSDRFKLDNLKKLYDESISFNDQLDSIVDRYYIDIEKLKIIFYKDFERLSIDNELKEKIFEKIDEFDKLVELRDDYLNKINKFKESKVNNNHVKYSVDDDEEDGNEESLNNKFEELSNVTISALPLIDLISKSLKLKGIDTDELNFELEKLHKWFEELLKIFKKVNLKKTDVTKTTEISSNIGKN